MIVDDEQLVILSLEHFFSRHEERYELVGKAYSGLEAIDLALELKPDILLTDIVMPGMYGTELIEQLKPQLPRTEFVILSAYSDFEYAKKALRMNVQDYIIKVPLSEADIFDALDHASANLALMEKKQEELNELNQSRLENLYRIRRQIVTELLQGEIVSEQITKLAQDLRLSSEFSHYICFLVEVTDVPRMKRSYTQKDQGALRYGIINIVEETAGEYGRAFACEIRDFCVLGIVEWPESSRSHGEDARRTLGTRIIDNIAQFLKQHVHVAISSPQHSGWSTLVAAFKNAEALMGEAYYFSDEGQLFYPLQPSGVKKEIGEVPLWLADITSKCTPETRLVDIRKSLSRVRDAIRERRLPETEVRSLLLHFAEELRQKAKVWRSLLPPLPRVLYESAKFLEHWEALTDFIADILTPSHASIRPEISKAKQYIEEHLTERLTLEDVAEQVNLVPTYLSTLFKKEENENFVDYVNRRKIERAVALLRKQNYSNLQLCQLVGIQNESYLCTLFKQYYGLPPQKFRKAYL